MGHRTAYRCRCNDGHYLFAPTLPILLSKLNEYLADHPALNWSNMKEKPVTIPYWLYQKYLRYRDNPLFWHTLDTAEPSEGKQTLIRELSKEYSLPPRDSKVKREGVPPIKQRGEYTRSAPMQTYECPSCHKGKVIITNSRHSLKPVYKCLDCRVVIRT